MRRLAVDVRIKFVPRDAWVGVYVGPEKYPAHGGKSRKIFLCLVPCLPVIIHVRWTS